MSHATLDRFTRQYLETMLWSTNDDSDPETGGNPLDDNYSIDDIAPEAIAQAVADCERFQAENAGALEAAAEWLAEEDSEGEGDATTRAAHLFWLNRNGHGCGFWEGDGEACESLSKASKAFGEVWPYVGDDGLVYGLGETLPRRMSVRVTFSTLTEESVSEGDHAGNGWMQDNGDRQPDGEQDTPEWSLRDALRFMSEKNTHVETCWCPTDGLSRLTLQGTGCTDDCEGDEIGVNYDLHVDGVSDGTMMRIARLLRSNGVYFANRVNW